MPPCSCPRHSQHVPFPFGPGVANVRRPFVIGHDIVDVVQGGDLEGACLIQFLGHLLLGQGVLIIAIHDAGGGV